MSTGFQSRARWQRIALNASVLGALIVIVLAVACDKVPLFAPSNSSITLNAASTVLPTGGSTTLTAMVLESAGTPVQNGTTVTFTTSLGRVDPAQTQTRNGIATATFFADSASGTAAVRASSGGIGAGSTPSPSPSPTPSASSSSTSNTVSITIGAAAATALTVSAAPATLPPSGGTSTITALATDAVGNRVRGALITFSTTAGTLSAASATTDDNGEAQVLLTTTRTATVTARGGNIGSTTPPTVTVTVGSRPSISLAVTPTNPVAGQPVTLTITSTVPEGASVPSLTVNWGDGTQETVGAVPAGSRTLSHIYNSAGSFTITVTSTADGEASTSSIGVTVGPAPSVAITATPTSGPAATTTFAFTVTPATGSAPQNVRIDFGDGNAIDLGGITAATTVTHRYNSAGQYTVRVTQTNPNGTTSTALVVITAT